MFLIHGTNEFLKETDHSNQPNRYVLPSFCIMSLTCATNLLRIAGNLQSALNEGRGASLVFNLTKQQVYRSRWKQRCAAHSTMFLHGGWDMLSRSGPYFYYTLHTSHMKRNFFLGAWISKQSTKHVFSYTLWVDANICLKHSEIYHLYFKDNYSVR